MSSQFAAANGVLGHSTDASAITPGRNTVLTLDVAETVQVERPTNIVRRGVEVARRAAQGQASDAEMTGLRFYSSGCWGLAPVQNEISNLHESTTGASHIFNASDFNHSQIGTGTTLQNLFQEVLTFAQTALLGAGYTGNVPVTGDRFLVKRIPTGASVDPSSYGANAGFDSALPSVTLPTLDVPMDRAAHTTATFPNDQGFFLRWSVPGTNQAYLRYVYTAYFGQYGLVIRGDGRAELWEYCAPTSGSIRWVRRDRWRFAPEGTAPGTGHCMTIFPHKGGNGERFLLFGNLALDVAPDVNTAERAADPNTATGEHVYRVDGVIRGTDIDASPGSVTKSDVFRFDVRRDLRLSIQISKLAFLTTGTLTDDSGLVAQGVTANTSAMTLSMSKVEPSGCSVSGVINDAQTESAFVPGTSQFPQVVFTFSGSGDASPLLWGYRMKQAGVQATSAPGAFSLQYIAPAGLTPATEGPRRVSVTGYAGDPQEEAATVNAVDLTNQHTRLQKRAIFSARLTTAYTPPGASSPVTVTLFSGRAENPRSIQQGSGGYVYPAAGWHEYDLSLRGMWARLAERVEPPIMRSYAIDPDAPPDPMTGALPPYKVTSVLKELISACGFPGSQIAIPDLPIRLWPGMAGKVDDLVVMPAANLAEMCVRLCREFLGAYLHFEPNAGADGQWMLLFGTQPATDGTFAPVWNFVSNPPTGFRPPYHPGSFPANTTFIASRPHFGQVKPDFNMVEVSADQPTTTANTRLRSVAFAYNYLSFKVPGSTVDPNPEGPDYVGHAIPYLLISPSLAGFTYADTAAAVAWTCRRYYDFLCHTQRVCHLTAPLIFVQDPLLSSSANGGWRMLRFQDPVSVDGDNTWLVKSVKVSYDSDRMQMAEYELIQPFPGQFFIGHDGKEYQRRQLRRMAQRAGGMSTQSALHGLFSASPHKEQTHLELPVVRQHFGPLQDSTGAFHPLPGYDAATGGPG